MININVYNRALTEDEIQELYIAHKFSNDSKRCEGDLLDTTESGVYACEKCGETQHGYNDGHCSRFLKDVRNDKINDLLK